MRSFLTQAQDVACIISVFFLQYKGSVACLKWPVIVEIATNCLPGYCFSALYWHSDALKGQCFYNVN